MAGIILSANTKLLKNNWVKYKNINKKTYPLPTLLNKNENTYIINTQFKPYTKNKHINIAFLSPLVNISTLHICNINKYVKHGIKNFT